jgi:stage V sporulation protein SpoVS
VSGTSVPTVVAGALASRCREEQAVALVGIGMDAVSNAVSALLLGLVMCAWCCI